jgi:predicted amidophosphoribosyltransferase
MNRRTIFAAPAAVIAELSPLICPECRQPRVRPDGVCDECGSTMIREKDAE